MRLNDGLFISPPPFDGGEGEEKEGGKGRKRRGGRATLHKSSDYQVIHPTGPGPPSAISLRFLTGASCLDHIDVKQKTHTLTHTLTYTHAHTHTDAHTQARLCICNQLEVG